MKRFLSSITMAVGALLIMGATALHQPASAEWAVTNVQERPAGKTFIGDLGPSFNIFHGNIALLNGHGTATLSGQVCYEVNDCEDIDKRFSGSITQLVVHHNANVPAGWPSPVPFPGERHKVTVLVQGKDQTIVTEWDYLTLGTNLAIETGGSWERLNVYDHYHGYNDEPQAGVMRFNVSIVE